METEKEVVIAKGKRAKAITLDPILQECLAKIREKQLLNIQASSAEQGQKRESAYFMLKAVESLEMELNSMYSNGKLEESKILKN